MPIVSIITSVHAGTAAYLSEAYESVRGQDLPPGWPWQWVVQEDGQTGIPAALPADPRISAATSRPGRAAMARTMALSHACGALVRMLGAR